MGSSEPLRAQPELLDLATQHPGAPVKVIVQKRALDISAETLVTQLGGTVTMDLHIINAFAATLPAAAVPQIAAAPGVRWVSFDALVVKTDCTSCVSSARLTNAYIRTIRADQVWNESPYPQGQGVGVAVVDSGVNPAADFYTAMGSNRIVASIAYNGGYNRSVYDGFGHGTHVAGIIGGNGRLSAGAYMGVAPMVNMVNVKVSDDQGTATASNVVNGLQ